MREQFDWGPNLSLLILWSRPQAEKLGILKFCRANPEHPIPEPDYEAWEQLAIRAYMDRNHIGEES